MKNIIFIVLLILPIQVYSQRPDNTEFISWIRSQSPESLAKNTADITAKNLPVQIDQLTLLYGIYATGNVITLRVQVQSTKEGFIKSLRDNGQTLSSYMLIFKKMVSNMGCSQEVNAAYIAQGVDYRYLVTDNQYIKLFEESVTDCP